MKTDKKQISEPTFTHLNVHSHFSFLNGMCKIPELISKAKQDGMYAMALTDSSGMFGIKEFLNTAEKRNANEPLFKPIVGMEAYCAQRTMYDKSCSHWEKDPVTNEQYLVDYAGWRLTLLAKNLQGYYSLCRLTSLSYTDGMFKDIPRIDRYVLAKNKEGIIILSGGIKGELSQLILQGKADEAESLAAWFKEQFGEDYYIELNRHKTDKPNANHDRYLHQMKVEPELIRIARKLNIKLVATNDVHFVMEEHGEAHDRILCLASQQDIDDPKRYHDTKQEWLKSPKEMQAVFSDLPEALETTMEIADKVEMYSINNEPNWQLVKDISIPQDDIFIISNAPYWPATPIPEELSDKIKTENDYLEYLVWKGAQKRYGNNSDTAHIQRITSELNIIKKKGVAAYFLLVWNIVRAAREELGVRVGPGRGSAAGSIVAYCLHITDVDPIKYGLLFERFYYTRSSMPDIDLDFDADGRQKVIEWVKKTYGSKRVAHIVSYGTVSAKSSLADMQRLEKMPIETIEALKKLVPNDIIRDENGKAKMPTLKNCTKYVPEFRRIMEGDDNKLKQALTYAAELEGINRSIGLHACGIIISSQDICNIAPVWTVKDSASGKPILVTQYDAHAIEHVGLVKMDFLGLNALTTIERCAHIIKNHLDENFDIDNIPLDDELTYKLFSEGNTVGVFQFESTGLQMKLRKLQTRTFEDLIAMNAMYRPGSMNKIAKLIDRKHGNEEISYTLPEMEEVLKSTYGLTLYQEQMMQLSQKLAGFTPGQSTILRNAICNKMKEAIDWLEPKFFDGGQKKGHSKEALAKIWEEWKSEGCYAFNKSHAVCYTWVAYQCAYLKAHYPEIYMSILINQAQGDTARFEELAKDCQANGLTVEEESPTFCIGHNINASISRYIVKKQPEDGTNNE